MPSTEDLTVLHSRLPPPPHSGRYASIEELSQLEPELAAKVDMVDIFRRSEEVRAYLLTHNLPVHAGVTTYDGVCHHCWPLHVAGAYTCRLQSEGEAVPCVSGLCTVWRQYALNTMLLAAPCPPLLRHRVQTRSPPSLMTRWDCWVPPQYGCSLESSITRLLNMRGATYVIRDQTIVWCC